MNINEVIDKIGEDKLKDFEKFMRGQTIGMNDDGSYDYYPQDVDRFMWTTRFVSKKADKVFCEK